jgi:hypothetical protein
MFLTSLSVGSQTIPSRGNRIENISGEKTTLSLQEGREEEMNQKGIGMVANICLLRFAAERETSIKLTDGLFTSSRFEHRRSNRIARVRPPFVPCFRCGVSQRYRDNERLPRFSSSTARQRAWNGTLEAIGYFSEPSKSSSLLSIMITDRTQGTIKRVSM